MKGTLCMPLSRRRRIDWHPLRATVVEQFLRDKGLEKSVGVEIGVFRGQTTFHLLGALPELSIVAIDSWRIQPYADKEGVVRERNFAAVEGSFDKRALHFPNRLAKVKDTSVSGLSKFPTGHFDWAFIDADHEYQAVKADIEAVKRVVRPGGWILGHDYTWDGVRRAVDELLPGAYWLGKDSVWTVQHQ